MFTTCELGVSRSEESIHPAKVLQKHVQGIGIPKASWWIDIPAEYRIPIAPVCEHFRTTLRTRPNDPLWATAFADQIIMIAISVVHQAWERQLLFSAAPAVRAMVQTIPPSWLFKDSSVREEDVQIL